MDRTGNIEKSFSLKELEEIVSELWNKGDIPIIKYIGSGLYNIKGCILNENMLKEIDKAILNKIRTTAK